MAHVYPKENGIILAERLVGLVGWVNHEYIIAFGMGNIIQDGNLNFGKREKNKKKLYKAV